MLVEQKRPNNHINLLSSDNVWIYIYMCIDIHMHIVQNKKKKNSKAT